MATQLSTPVFAAQNTTRTNDLSDDGYTWPSASPIIVDKFGKLFVFVQRQNAGDKRLCVIVSNDHGATWSDPTLTNFTDASGEGFDTIRAGIGYDSTNDIAHAVLTAGANEAFYRRYTFTRDGSHNITGVSRKTDASMDLDTTTVSIGFPSCLWIPEGGTFGSVVAFWSITTTLGAEARASMRVLSNTSADGVAANWIAPVTSDAPTYGSAPDVAYTKIATQALGDVGAVSAHRKAAGTNINDVYVGYSIGASTPAGANIKFRRMRWNSGANDWSTGLSAEQTMSAQQVSGTDTGYGFKYQLLSQWGEDTTNDKMYIAYPVWASNLLGDTPSFTQINAASDTVAARVSVYSAGGAHSFAPTLDSIFDNTSSRLVVSYIKTTTDFAYIRTFNGTTADQAETLMFNTAGVDIPLLCATRVGAGSNKMLSAFRDITGSAPFTGYAGTMDWAAPSNDFSAVLQWWILC